MTAGRMEAFSDGVIAIIITIMVLELRQPHGVSFASLRPVYPEFLAYVLSFLNLGIYWNNHHHMLRTVRRVTGPMLWCNLHLLFWLSLFPFCTRWMATNHFARDTVVAYGIVLMAAGAAYYTLQHVIIASQAPDTSLKDLIGRDLKGKGSIVAYALSIPLTFAWHYLGVIVFAAVGLVWLIPDRRIEHYLDHHAPGE